MPRLVVLVALAALLAAPATAQSGETPLAEGARALAFGVDGIGLTSLYGTSLGLKWHRSEARAVRLGVTVEARAEAVFDAEQDVQLLFAQASLVPLHYRRGRTPVYLYTGIGPTGYIDARRTNREAQSAETDATLAVGLAGVAGVEWIVAKAIGVTGEYSQQLVLQGRLGEGERIGVAFQPTGIRLGVAVYF